MMWHRHETGLIAVFFCVLGWVYAAPASGAEDADSAKTAAVPTTRPEAAAAPVAPQPETPAAADLPQGQKVSVGTLGQIDLHVKGLELAEVLRLLSIQSQRNIIASRSVSGPVTADLYGVDFYQALDAILQQNGYVYREKGNFIYVYTAAELKAVQEVDRKVDVVVRRLNYISAADASTFVTPLLSSAGAISLSGPPSDGFAPTVTDGGANKFAHADTLVIRDYPENQEKIKSVLDQLDVRPKQISIQVTVLEAVLSENNGWGVDSAVVADLKMMNFTNPFSPVTDLLSGNVKGNATVANTATTSQTTQQNATFKVGVMSNDVGAFIYALDQVTHTTTLANPKVLVLNRQKASLLVGKQLAYLSTTATSTTSTQTVEYLNTGTQLSVRPFAGEDGFIRMELKPSISTGTLRAIGGTTVPDAATEEMTSNVMVRSGQTIILGGLFTETTTVGKNQVPGLGDIPLLGAAFKGQDDSISRSEVIFLVTPTLEKDEALYAVGERMNDSIELAKIGARQGLLPWSKTKLTEAAMATAIENEQSGNTGKALWEANLALYLDPHYVEARRLKEKLTGEHTGRIDQSLLREAIDRVIDRHVGPLPTSPKAAAPNGPTTQPAAAATAQPSTASNTAVNQVSGAAIPMSTAAPATQPVPAASGPTAPQHAEASEDPDGFRP